MPSFRSLMRAAKSDTLHLSATIEISSVPGIDSAANGGVVSDRTANS